MEVSEIESADTYEKIYRNKCWICLRQAVEICELFRNGDAIPHKLMAVASVQIKEGDGLPPVICLPCNQCLTMLDRFTYTRRNARGSSCVIPKYWFPWKTL